MNSVYVRVLYIKIYTGAIANEQEYNFKIYTECEISLAISVSHVLLACMHTRSLARLLAFYTLNRHAIRNLIRRWIRCAFDKKKNGTNVPRLVDFIYYLLHLANRIAYTYFVAMIHVLCMYTIVNPSSMSEFSQNLFPETTIATHMCSAHTMNKQINKQTIAFSFACCVCCTIALICSVLLGLFAYLYL